MQLLCPHCHNPIEAVALDLAHETLCPSCGSTFRLDMGSTVTWPPSEGPGTLGPYELVGMVGTGELGSVYKAHDPELDRTVAIKMPHAGILVSDEDRKRFLREARNVAHLAYPSIVPVHEVGEHGGIPFLVADFVEGVTLSDNLSGRQPTFREAATLAAEVADALEYVQEHGVVHREIKPSNILLDEQGKPQQPVL